MLAEFFVHFVEKKERVKWLSTHRGWWLKWVSSVPRHNGMFIMEGGPAGDFVAAGGTWGLRHHRWKGYVVGASQGTNAKYGGRMMGLLKAAQGRGGEGRGKEEDDEVEEEVRTRESFSKRTEKKGLVWYLTTPKFVSNAKILCSL